MILPDEICLAIVTKLLCSLYNFIITGFNISKWVIAALDSYMAGASWQIFVQRSADPSALVSRAVYPALPWYVVLRMFKGQVLIAEAGLTCHAVKAPSFKLPVSLVADS